MCDKFRDKIWSTRDVSYASKKYVCRYDIEFPAGTITCLEDCKTLSMALHITTSDVESYYNPGDGVYAKIFCSSHCMDYCFESSVGPIIVGCGKILSKDQFDELLKFATLATVYEPYCSTKPDGDKKLNLTFGDYNMSRVVSQLLSDGKVKVRHTDHEFRADNRNITWVEGIWQCNYTS